MKSADLKNVGGSTTTVYVCNGTNRSGCNGGAGAIFVEEYS